jgi:hypothetical protein
MVLKYADTPQLHYGGQQSDPWKRFPQGSQPIATAPAASATPLLIYDATGKGYWALRHRDGWQKLSPYKDHVTGAVSWRMNGEQVQQPIAWALPQKR